MSVEVEEPKRIATPEAQAESPPASQAATDDSTPSAPERLSATPESAFTADDSAGAAPEAAEPSQGKPSIPPDLPLAAPAVEANADALDTPEPQAFASGSETAPPAASEALEPDTVDTQEAEPESVAAPALAPVPSLPELAQPVEALDTEIATTAASAPADETAIAESSPDPAPSLADPSHPEPVAEARSAPGAPTVPSYPPGHLPVPGLPDLAALDDDLVDEALEVEDPGEFPELASESGPRIRPGSLCKGMIVAVHDSGVIVSFGAKVEGHVPLDEFRGVDGVVSVQPGQEIEVLIERLGAPGDYAALSYKRARESEAWAVIEEAHAKNLSLQGRILERVKGGLRVDIGISAFMPASQVDVRPVRNLDVWLEKTVEVAVVECDRRRANVVVSRSHLLKAQQQERRAATLSKLKVGEPATGTVKNIATFGVFVDLGGIDGLIKLAELSYGRVENPAAIIQPGSEVTAKVLRIDTAKDRVALSLRAMEPDPWATIQDRYVPGQTVRGRVASVKDYGAFVEIEPGVEGLIHSSEIDWSRRPKHPSKTFSANTETEAVVLSVKPSERRISLSFKQLTPDPWIATAGSLEVGDVVKGVVRRIETYGLFVEIVPGVEGLVHVSDLSWDTRSAHPREVARKGQEITTVILQADHENRRLALGVKQLQPDVWDEFLSDNSVGDTLPGTVRRIAKFGAFVELAAGVEGLCHSSQLPKDRSAVKPGERYKFEILDVNERARRIGLRCRQPIPTDAGA